MPRTLIRGRGPGPYNVLVEEDDGRKVVVTYRTWKYRYRPFEKKEHHLADAIFRSILATVEFEPREQQAGGKDVRNITVQQFGVKEQAIKVGATLWPSHAHVAVEKGDIVALRGKFTQNKTTNGEGVPVTYNNLSVTGITVLGKLDPGVKVESENAVVAPADEVADDDIPF